jgi:hypothetical protein
LACRLIEFRHAVTAELLDDKVGNRMSDPLAEGVI